MYRVLIVWTSLPDVNILLDQNKIRSVIIYEVLLNEMKLDRKNI
jgi:hypothetical protein